ncbi:hypothetical protein [Adlercreutzia sp. ZJ473]|uniref:hypothetical protein n=1 Tax=Adlercreutzia sp. ZJ473 TaxID=2722822 RepID=UPI00155313E9|nr:hypothetical protein [Adlercreutzia sp. ZJ473]
MKNNKVYFPKDAIARHENFDAWYEDGALFMRFESDWKFEKDTVAVIGRMGGEVGCIKPDHKVINYYLRSERYEHCLHTYTIFKHYYVEGMLWDMYGSLSNPPCDFITETKDRDDKRDVHIKVVKFRDKGECFEIRVTDLTKLRLALIATVAIGIKEEWKGLSEGEEDPNPTFFQKIKRNVRGYKGKTYERVLQEEELERAKASLKAMEEEE